MPIAIPPPDIDPSIAPRSTEFTEAETRETGMQGELPVPQKPAAAAGLLRVWKSPQTGVR